MVEGARKRNDMDDGKRDEVGGGEGSGTWKAGGGEGLRFPIEGAETEDRVGDYRILEMLGSGGQGAVYLAEDVRLGRKVALKILQGFTDPTGSLLRRFRREAAITSRLDHPGICPVYEAGSGTNRFRSVERMADWW